MRSGQGETAGSIVEQIEPGEGACEADVAHTVKVNVGERGRRDIEEFEDREKSEGCRC